MPDDIHEVYAIRYGHHSRRSPANFIHGDPHDILQPLDYFVWAIVGPSGVIVVDTGFDESMGKKRQREMVKPVRDGLQALGIAAETVKAVIISHMHYDHCGNYDLFPQARYHLQDREMAYATGRCMCHQALRAPFEVEDVVAMVRKVFLGPRRISRPRQWHCPRRHRPSHRRSLQRAAERTGEDAPRLRGAGRRCHAPLRPHGRRTRISHHLQHRRGSGGI
jgi:hypothetical protein